MPRSNRIIASATDQVVALLAQGKQGHDALEKALGIIEQDEQAAKQKFEQDQAARAARRNEILGLLGRSQPTPPQTPPAPQGQQTGARKPGRPAGSKNKPKNGNGKAAGKASKRGRKGSGDFNATQAVLDVIDSLTGKASAAEITEKALAKHHGKLNAGTAASALQALRKSGRVGFEGEPRNYSYFKKAAAAPQA